MIFVVQLITRGWEYIRRERFLGMGCRVAISATKGIGMARILDIRQCGCQENLNV